ncbi:tRNA-dihydrouridine synthase 2 [Microbotryomycetes sp. JL201]|nr:tRNA-dihydrouridine synthase 2 [Microbotryomycetes sp. JL201]
MSLSTASSSCSSASLATAPSTPPLAPPSPRGNKNNAEKVDLTPSDVKDERPLKRSRLDDNSTAPSSSKVYTTTLPYNKGLHLAPMVRIGTLPVRLVALEHGASIVWGPEIVDKAIIGAERVVDASSGTIKYIKNNRQVWETHPIEKSRLIFQLGSSDPDLAVQAAKVVEQDVGGIGLNCGCPKHFSIQAGMGAALLKEPRKLCSILHALVTNLSVPIDVKIRLFDEPQETFDLVEQLLDTGVSALTVHCRTKEMRSREPAMLDRLSDIVKIGQRKRIPVIANGDCFSVQDKDNIRQLTGVDAIMIARGAEANPSCFDERGYRDLVDDVIPRILKIAIKTNQPFGNIKYILNSLDLTKSSVNRPRDARTKIKLGINQAKTYEQMMTVVGLDADQVVQEVKQCSLEHLVPRWNERRKDIATSDSM